MKKAAVILLAAFYILLSGGSYVCAMHCAAVKVIKPAVSDCCSEMGNMPMACHKAKHTDDDCTKKHGSFVIKENLKPSFSFDALKQIPLITTAPFENYAGRYNTVTAQVIYQQSKAPPLSGRAYIIQLRTLLI